MAETNIATTNALRKVAWETKLYRATEKNAYMMRLSGEGPDNVIQIKKDLEKEQGDKMIFGLIPRISGNWKKNDAILEGNEQALTTYDMSLELNQHRTAVRDDGEMSRKRVMFDLSKESEAALRVAGSEMIDNLIFDELGVGTGLSGETVTDPTYIAYPTATAGSFSVGTVPATVKAALHATNSKLTMDFISFLKMVAKNGRVAGVNRTFEPIRPYIFDGKPVYILLTSPSALLDLKQTSDFKSAMRDAEVRGSDNPIFRGATAFVDGVVIHEHENVATAADGGGASVNWSKGVLLGAQALAFAWGRQPEIIEKKFDFDNKIAYAWSMVCKAKKSAFNLKDYGSLGVYLSHVN